ncbi:MAG TPA: glycerate kinase [Pseudonocardiaceae bacterium]
MHVLVAPDKFKGSLRASEVAAHVAAGLRAAVPGVEVVRIPVADGGDGTLDAAAGAGFGLVRVRVSGPTGEAVDTAYAVRGDLAVVELADACGLHRLPGGRLAPLAASSAGVGEVLRAVLDTGCSHVVLGIGGSASTDGGAGMLTALGARLLDPGGAELPPGGGALRRLDRVDLTGLHPALRRVDVLLASDVDNPLLGPNGAAAVYGPQKGAAPADIEALDAGLARWSSAVAAALGTPAGPHGHPAADLPGAGAAGGAGFAAMAVLGARMRPGIELFLELTGFADRLPGARLVVTGEGSLDAQTLRGKAPAGVAAAARAAGTPVVAVAGRSLLSGDELAAAGIAAAYTLADLEPDPDRSMAMAGPLLEQVARRLAADWLSGDPRSAAAAGHEPGRRARRQGKERAHGRRPAHGGA